MKKIVSAKACWIVSGIAVSLLFLARLPSADAAGSVPVVQSTATPPPCVGSCHTVSPDVIALTNVRGTQPIKPRPVIFLTKANPNLVISRIVRFPQELDIELTASDGTHETIHLPFSVPPSSSLFLFPRDATLDSVISIGSTARILYHRGSGGQFHAYTLSQAPSITADTVSQAPLKTAP